MWEALIEAFEKLIERRIAPQFVTARDRAWLPRKGG
jgi:hypothetical protein